MSVFTKMFSKRESSVSADRVSLSMMSQWSPLEMLTPSMLAQILNAVKGGELQAFARIWEDVRRRDDMISGVEPKRRKDVARLDYEIVQLEASPAADRQKEVVEKFFGTLRYTDVMDTNKVGGVAALVRGMMLSVGFGWSVQEIVWKPSASGLTAELKQVPLWFFERRLGRLRYLKNDGDYDGAELEDGGWLITASDDILAVASLVLYLYKHMPLRDWLVYCQRYVVPGLHGKTPAKLGSSEWDDLKNALYSFGQDWAMLTGTEVEIKPVDASSKGPLPYGPLVERCDKCLASLWRGGDLSTSSGKDTTGAMLQTEERDTLLADDSALIEDTLNAQLVAHAVHYAFGDVPILVSFRLQRPNTSTDTDLKVYSRLFEWGVPVAISDIRERFGVPTPDEDEELVFTTPGLRSRVEPTLNAASPQPSPLKAAALFALAGDLAPLRDALIEAAAASDDDLAATLNALQARIPQLHEQINASTGFQTALAEMLAHGISDGLNDNPSKVTDA